MPLYDYQCKQCNTVTEVRHGFKDVFTDPCPQCGGTVARVFNPAGIVFKGSGFYITDSRKAQTSSEGSPAVATPAATPAAPAAGASTPAAPATPAAAAPASKKSDAA